MLRGLVALAGAVMVGLCVGQLDIVASAEGRLVPRTLVKIVQPAEGGVVTEILVAEGADVVAGEPLIRLDARIAEADVRALRAEHAHRQLQVRRIDAELAESALAREPGDPEPAFLEALARWQANLRSHRDAVAQAVAQIERLAQEHRAASEVEAKLARTAPIVRSAAARYETLRREGFVSELVALDRERERIERDQDLRAQAHTVRALEASLAQAQRQLEQTVSDRRRALHAERADASAHVARLREEVDKQRVRRERIDLRAPQSGTVKALATQTVGSVVAPGTVLVTLVPAGEPLEAEVRVRNEDAGFVRAGQRAQVKVAAFPFQKYGLLEARVVRVGPDAEDATANRGSGEAVAPAGDYRARVALDAQSLAYEGTRLALASGMAVVAEIHLGRRPVLDYVLGPLRKAWHESARER